MYKFTRIISIVFLLALCNNFYGKNSIENINHNSTTRVPALLLMQNDTIINKPIYPPIKRDFNRLGLNMALFAGASIVVVGILWVLPEEVSNWDKHAIIENGITDKWTQNVKAGPVWDKDDFFINYVAHPMVGAYYYMIARSSGFKSYESFLCSAIISTFLWEYGIEAFAEIPSYQDLIITPIVGSIIGEGFFYAKKSIIKHDDRILGSRALGKTTKFLIDPFNSALDAFGYKQKINTNLNIAPVGFNNSSSKPIWGLQLSVKF